VRLQGLTRTGDETIGIMKKRASHQNTMRNPFFRTNNRKLN
jgi:hypothetical protein